MLVDSLDVADSSLVVAEESLVAAEESVEMVVEDVIGGPVEDSVLVPTMVDNGTWLDEVPAGVGVAVAPMVLTT